MKKRKIRRAKIVLHPVMTFMIMILCVVVLSGLLKLFNFAFSYNSLNLTKLEYVPTTESVTSLLNLRGIKYIFANTVSNFANFTILSNLIIVLLGIGVMEYSGFLKIAVGLLTKRAKKNAITYVIVLLCLLSSIMGNLPFIAFIPLVALIFKHGKRNPNIGIIASFAAMTCGYGLSVFFSSVDSSLSTITKNAANVLDPAYSIGSASLMLIMLVGIIILSFVITNVTENYIAKKLPKYEFSEEEVLEDNEVSRNELKGLILAGIGSITYVLFLIYNIIPGLPFSGNFLNYRETLYIDKLFGPESFFSNGFVFVITLLFIIWGLLYGIGAKTIKNNRDFVDSLGHNLNGVGKILVYIFASATFISVFKQTNIGNVVVAGFTSLISNSNFSGLALIVLLFISTIISTLFVPNTVAKWSIMAYQIVPTFLNAGISAEFTQTIFRFAESSVLNLTPVFSYFIIYLAYLEYYNQNKNLLSMGSAIKYQTFYSLCTAGVLLALIIIWYLISLPLGFGGNVAL